MMQKKSFFITSFLLFFVFISACTPDTEVMSVTQIIPVTEIIPVTQIIPVTEIIEETQISPTSQLVPVSVTFTVLAGEDWQSSNITLAPEYQVTIFYLSGIWTFNLRGGDKYYVGPDGYFDEYVSSLDGQCGQAPLPDEHKGALIAKIGNGPAFFIGSRYTFKVEQSGLLNFRINDDCMGDDTGQIVVQIDITP
jgi:hypothetical protein